VRHDQPDPADDAADRDNRGGHQRRGDNEHETKAARVDAKRLRLLIAERHQVHAPAQKMQRHEAEQDERRGAEHIGGRDGGKAAEQPEGDRRQLIVRVGQHLQERDHRAGERAQHDASQHQNQDRLAAADRRGDGVDEAHRRDAEDEGQQLDADHG
jgi:hypothetical protein